MRRAWMAFALVEEEAMIDGSIDEYGTPPPGSQCHLCGTRKMSNALVIGISPPEGKLMGSNVVICGNCIGNALNKFEQSGDIERIDNAPSAPQNWPVSEKAW